MFASRRIAILGKKGAPFKVEFDGFDDYIEVSSAYSSLTGNSIGYGYYDTLDSPFAISVWVNAKEQGGNRMFISKGFFQQIAGANKGWGFGFTDFTMSRSLHTTNTTTAVLQGSAGFALFRISSGNDQIAAASTITDGVRLAWTKTGSPTGTGLLYLMGIK